MYNICIHSIVFQLCLMKRKERRWTKLKFLRLVFLTLLKVSGTYKVDLTLEQLRDVVYKLFALLCFVFLGAAPILYVQVAILNLPHPYVRSTQTCQPSRIARVTPAFIHILMLNRRICPITRIQKLVFAHASALYSGAGP